MSENVISQAVALLQGFTIGVVVGLIYDVLRVLRVRVKIPFLGHALDLLFWATVTMGIFLWSQVAWGGRIRLYGVGAIATGSIFYFSTFTTIFLWICFLFADIFEFILNVLYLPVTLLVWLEKKFKKFVKNLFLFLLKWYKIYSMTGALERAIELSEKQEKGGVGDALYACRCADKNGSSRNVNLSRRHVAHRSWGSTVDSVSARPVAVRRHHHGRGKSENVPRPRV